MKTKSILLTASLALASLAFGKSYDIVLSTPTQVGSVTLTAGQYSLKVVNGNAVFTNLDSAKTFTAPAKLQTADHKFDATAVDTAKQGSSEKIQKIELGGSNTELEFGE